MRNNSKIKPEIDADFADKIEKTFKSRWKGTL